jgi:uncharacterized membrane protein
MFDQISTSNFIGILSIAIVLIYLSIKIIKSTNSEEKFTEMQTYWFIFIFFIFGAIILTLGLIGFSSAMILFSRFLDSLGWLLIPLVFGLVWLVNRSK